MWYTHVKWWYILAFFDVFKISIFWVARRVKGKKWPKMTEIYVCHSQYLRKHISWFLVHLCKMMTSPGASFIFLSVTLGISGTVPHIWLWFLVHMCKMMVSPAIFSFLKNSNFWVFRGRVKRQKMTRYDQFQSVTFYISRTLDHIIKIFSTQV